MNSKNVKQIIIIALLAAAAVAIIRVAPLAWVMTAGLRTPIEVPEPDYWPTEGWRTSTPEEQGFDSLELAKGLQSLQETQAEIDSLLIIRNGYMVLDAHFEPYNGKFPHDLASVTKSVLTTLIGIAVEQGKLELDQPVISFFPNRKISNLGKDKESLTIRHLASMRNGMESGCVGADEPTLDKMRAQPDWVQAALDRPMVAKPGTAFCYDSPGMHILSAILQEATGMTALEFAQQNLFKPLGIQNAIWESDPQGYTRGWGDLHLLPEDIAKIGYLWLHRGKWDGQQVVPETWVLDSVKLHSNFIEPDFGYGYGWWISTGDYQALGRGGQRVRVIASRNTIVTVTSVNSDYSEISSWLTPILLQLDGSLSANPKGLAALEEALKTVEQGPAELKAVYTPETARLVTNKTYQCENNPASVESVRIAFDDPGQATLNVKMNGTENTWTIGLNGNYLVSPQGTGFRGYWEDERTFNFAVFNIGVTDRQVVFDGDDLEISFSEADFKVACQTQD